MRDSQLQSSEDAKSTYDVVGDLAQDVLQTPPIELVGGKELFTTPTFSNLFQSSLFAPIACCSAAFVVHTIVRRIKRVPYPPFRSAFKPAEIYGFIGAMQSTNAFNIDHLGLKLEDDDFKFIWMLTISFNKMNNKNFVMEYYEKRYRGPVIDVARETYPRLSRARIAWWTNHVWTTAKRRDAVRFLLSPSSTYGLSPHDIDVCVHIQRRRRATLEASV
ncbi:hypothetical protein A0H81_00071 [Grifola frondosa]|uniref:Uncharacterized protein n=1 Tax=Grifola frondosa TaxID=5627 RepID=A0A1C7MRM8_GRIFR|nr:hypothetical protein A0H81_00071 [Grifola frondosa]